jgi:hypothetical protein
MLPPTTDGAFKSTGSDWIIQTYHPKRGPNTFLIVGIFEWQHGHTKRSSGPTEPTASNVRIGSMLSKKSTYNRPTGRNGQQ